VAAATGAASQTFSMMRLNATAAAPTGPNVLQYYGGRVIANAQAYAINSTE